MERKKEEKIITEYYDEHVNDGIMLPLLKLSYRYFAVNLLTLINHFLFSIFSYNMEQCLQLLNEEV